MSPLYWTDPGQGILHKLSHLVLTTVKRLLLFSFYRWENRVWGQTVCPHVASAQLQFKYDSKAHVSIGFINAAFRNILNVAFQGWEKSLSGTTSQRGWYLCWKWRVSWMMININPGESILGSENRWTKAWS